MAGFRLTDWVEYYKAEYFVLVRKSREPGDLKTVIRYEPLEWRYNRLMDLITPDEEGNDTDQKKQYRGKLFGPMHDMLVGAHPEFWEFKTIISLQMTAGEWMELPMRERGRLVALHQIDNQMQTLSRHLELQQQERESAARRAEDRTKDLLNRPRG